MRNDVDRYIVVEKNVYEKLTDYKNLKLEQGNKVFKVKVKNEWNHLDDLYFAVINSDYDFTNENLKIYVNSTNIFKF